VNRVEALAKPKAGGVSPDPAGELVARLESPLPRRLAVGAGNAIFVWGTCFHKRRRIAELRIGPRGSESPATALAMPRADLFDALHPSLDPLATRNGDRDDASEEDPLLRSYRSGFWAIVGLDPVAGERRVEIEAVAKLDNGEMARAALGELDLLEGLPTPAGWPTAAGDPGRRVAICMATFEPPLDLLKRQIESIRAQRHDDWVCYLSDDHSAPEKFAALERMIDGDSRFVLSRSARRRGHYGNFERALSMAPPDSDFVAPCDQDDLWHPDKLETLIGAIGDASLVYSDARLVDGRGELIANTYWSKRRNNYTNIASLLIANTVTGAASLLRRDLVGRALPFPQRHGHPFHDHWLALLALATGRIAYVDRPLYDYVQHHHAAIGHARANTGVPRGPRALAARVRRVASSPRRTFANWRAIYFYDVLRLAQFVSVLERREGDRIEPRKRRALRRVTNAERSPAAFCSLAARRLRSLAGRNETMGAEGALLRGIAWRHAVALISGRRRPLPRIRGEARTPSLPEASGVATIAHEPTRTLAEKTRPLEIELRDDAPVRVNLLLPTIDLRHFFGGYLAKLNLARRLAERGHRVRIVTVDETPPLPRSWRREIEAYRGLDGVFERVEVAFGREGGPLEVSPGDRFVATTWWTAHIASAAARELGTDRFVYLIQEYEPFTFPMGALAAAAAESYELPHRALFSTELLREWFSEKRLGVFAAGVEAGERDSASFQNAITPIAPPSSEKLAGRDSRRLLFYARPEQHAARNMFELGLLALARAVEQGVIGPDWELNGVGTVSGRASIELGRGSVLQLLPHRTQDAYAGLLGDHDVGLALMYTPHPSLVPIEMASAGMLTVTNSFDNKTPEAMAQISGNLVTVAPTVTGVVSGLHQAIGAVDDFERRAAGAAVDWSRDWNRSFDEALLARVEGFLDVD
jgi:glycosyltransferase involved in cell wall biosynthesis